MLRKLIFTVVAIAVTALGAAFAANYQTAHGNPDQAMDCSICHGGFGNYPNTVTAVPSLATIAASSTYTVAITMNAAINGASGTGYWIANSTVGGATGSSTGRFAGGQNQGAAGNWTATMTAPASAGTYYYKVFGQSGPFNSTTGYSGFAVYSVTVSLPATATPTATYTPVPPTATPANTATPTNTAVPPTATSTPTATPTFPNNVYLPVAIKQ